MKKLFNKLLGPVVSIMFLLNMTSVGYAETTVSDNLVLTLTLMASGIAKFISCKSSALGR